MKNCSRSAWMPCVGALIFTASGCLPSLDNLDRGPLNGTFAVSDYYAPSGYMGDGARLGLLSATVNEGCLPRPPNPRGNCYAFTYYPNNIGRDPWAGVFWVFPSNNWGSSFGHAIDARPFKQVRFYAAVDGPLPYTFKGLPQYLSGFAGRIDPKGSYSSIGLTDHRDAFDVGVDALIGTDIKPELKQFRIPLSDFEKSKNCVDPKSPDYDPKQDPRNCSADLLASDLIGAFGWALHYPNDGDPSLKRPVKIYFDDIVWDTEAPPP